MTRILLSLWLIPVVPLLPAGISALARGIMDDYTFGK